jgi:hypothetical protein
MMTAIWGFLQGKYGPQWVALLSETHCLNAQGCLKLKWKLGGREEETVLNVELLRDASIGLGALLRFTEADWWSWSKGSSLFFWQWPQGEQQQFARDGMEVYIQKSLPQYCRAARHPKPIQ